MFLSAYRSLTPAQRAFVDSFVAGAESDCARRGDRISNVLHRPIDASVRDEARGMLDNAFVCAAIAERINDLAAQAELSPRRVLKEVLAIALANVTDLFDVEADGEMTLRLDKATPEQLSAVKSVDIDETGDGMSRARRKRTRIVMHDKLAALKMAFDYMGMNNPDNPYWRAENARPVTDSKPLPATMTIEQAADIYAKLIDG